jgi:hypothetical protein
MFCSRLAINYGHSQISAQGMTHHASETSKNKFLAQEANMYQHEATTGGPTKTSNNHSHIEVVRLGFRVPL